MPFLPLRGKTLPVEFAYEWIKAHIDVLWESGAAAVVNYKLLEWYPNADLSPLYPYYHKASTNKHDLKLEPIDYWYFEQMRQALDAYYGERASYCLAARIGFAWWSYLNDLIGDNIIPSYSYRELISVGIHKLTSQQLAEHRIRLAVNKFAEKMETKGRISTTLNDFDTGVQITFSQCPFCANGLPECNILYGVVQGMLLHLFGIQPVIKDRDGELIFSAASEIGQQVQYQLVDNDSHLVQLKFI